MTIVSVFQHINTLENKWGDATNGPTDAVRSIISLDVRD